MMVQEVEPGLEPVNILVVDDRPENRLAVQAILRAPGYRLVEAGSGPEALELLLREEFSALLIDVVMPGMDGFELASIIRARARDATIPILFLSAEARDMRQVFRGYELGAVDYLLKPLVPEVLRAKVAVFAQLYRQKRRIQRQSRALLEAERKEAEFRLLELRLASERRYRTLAEAVPQIVWSARADGEVDYFNQRWFGYTGLSAGPSSSGWLAAVHPEDAPRTSALWRESVQTGNTFEVECRLRREDGRYRWHLGRAIREDGMEPGTVSWLGTFTDIENQKRTQTILAEFKGTLDAVMDAILIFDPKNWRLLYVNQGTSSLLGFSPDELLRMTPADLLHDFNPGDFREMLQPLREGQKSNLTLETRFRKKQADGVPVEVSLQHIFINGGRMVLIARDITERKRAEAEREHLYDRALEGVRARDEFLSVASHELKTPLTSLRLYVDTLLRSAGGTPHLPPAAKAKLEQAQRQLNRLARLVEQLLDVSQLATGNFHTELAQAVDLADLVRDVLQRLKPDLTQAGCEVTVHAKPHLSGTWDRGLLEQVVTHLLSNAMKFGAGKPIELTLESDASTARLSIRDHGFGIPPEAQKRIFERFERAVSPRRYGGLGLGLYIARRVVEAHGGTIHVESQPGAGATFVVELPREPRPPRSLAASSRDLLPPPAEHAPPELH